MTRPHPVEGKARTRKPETVLRKVRESVNVARFQLNHDRVTGDNWVAVNQALLRALSRMSELRRSLRDEPVSKAYKLDTRGLGAVEHCPGCNCPVSPDCTMSCDTMSDCGHRPGPAPETCPSCKSTTKCDCDEFDVMGAMVEQHPIPSSRTPGMALGPAPEPVKPPATVKPFRSRGLGVDSTPGCFVCQQPEEPRMHANISAFVASKEDGERAVSMFGRAGARLDYRGREPDWIQVKVGACDAHEGNLKGLHGLVRECGELSAEIIERARTPAAGTAAVPTRRPLDKAAEWARMSGVDPRDPGPAPEPAWTEEEIARGKAAADSYKDVFPDVAGPAPEPVPTNPFAPTNDTEPCCVRCGHGESAHTSCRRDRCDCLRMKQTASTPVAGTAPTTTKETP